MKRKIYLVIIILSLIHGTILSQSDEKQPVKWWLQSSMADSTKNLLFHAKGKYSYTKMDGVVSGEMHSSELIIVLRKNVFTNYTIYKFNKMDLDLRNIINLNYATMTHYFTDFLDIDFSNVVYSQFGIIWEKDDALLIKNRYSFYTGIGLNNLLFEKLNIKSLFATGRINQDYIMPVDDLDVVKKPYAAFYIRQNYEFAISPELSLSGQVEYFTNINEMDRHRYGVEINLSVGLLKNVNLVFGYNYKYDRENIRLGIIPNNSTQNIGIDISL